MATRANIAAKDRKSREEIDAKNRALKEKELKIKKFEADSRHATESGKAAGTILRGIAAWNHPEWYKKFGSDMYVSELPNFARTGLVTLPGFLSNGGAGNYHISGNATLPGICVINYIPTLPNQPDSASGFIKSPVNVGLGRFMSELRKLNSRVGEYDPSDVGLYWYATADYANLIERIRQGIKAYNTYYISNAYYCDAVIDAIGFNPTNFKAHIAEYKYLVSRHISIFNSTIVIPNTLTFMLRRLWLATTIVKDHKGEGAQVYIFRQNRLGFISEDEDLIQYATANGRDMLYSNVETLLGNMARALSDSVGMQVIIADMRAGIPDGKQLRLPDLNETETLSISDDVFNLEQIHNLVTYPLRCNSSTLLFTPNAVQNANIIALSNGYLGQGSSSDDVTLSTRGPISSVNFNPDNYTELRDKVIEADNEFLNFYDTPSKGDDVLEATRLRATFNVITPASGAVTLQFVTRSRGTELVTHMDIYVHDQSLTLRKFACGTTMLYDKNDASQAASAFEMAAIMSKFDWMPKVKWVPITKDDSDKDQLDTYFTVGEIDQVVPLSRANLMNLHEQCTLSTYFINSSEFIRSR